MNPATSIRKLALGALAVASFFAGGNAAFAQVVTGTLGQASATTTIKEIKSRRHPRRSAA